MVQNLKVDIIYHLCPSDFEMEFNLNGRCRMRLLSTKTEDKKSFVKTLARNVARSRVIFACGPLFGSEGLISTVATAIGSGVAVCDNKVYGINSDDAIHIINGSTPLVTADGYFGGCIIESGPQTIILLTENRTFRKSIMQTLIHPYIEEISYLPTKASTLSAPVEEDTPFETAISEEEIYLTQPDDYDDSANAEVEPSVVAEDEHNIEFIMDGESFDNENAVQEPAPVFDSSYNMMYTTVENSKKFNSHYSDSYTPSESDNMFIAERLIDDDEQELAQNTNSRALDITIVILVLLLLLALLALVYLVVLRPFSMGVDPVEYLKEIFSATENSLI